MSGFERLLPVVHVFDRGDLVKYRGSDMTAAFRRTVGLESRGLGLVVSNANSFVRNVAWTTKISQPDVKVLWTNGTVDWCDVRQLILISAAPRNNDEV